MTAEFNGLVVGGGGATGGELISAMLGESELISGVLAGGEGEVEGGGAPTCRLVIILRNLKNEITEFRNSSKIQGSDESQDSGFSGRTTRNQIFGTNSAGLYLLGFGDPLRRYTAYVVALTIYLGFGLLCRARIAACVRTN